MKAVRKSSAIASIGTSNIKQNLRNKWKIESSAPGVFGLERVGDTDHHDDIVQDAADLGAGRGGDHLFRKRRNEVTHFEADLHVRRTLELHAAADAPQPRRLVRMRQQGQIA